MKRLFGIVLIICFISICVFCAGCVSEEEKQAAVQAESLARQMGPVARGVGVPQAAAYTKGRGVHPIVLISGSGGVHFLTTSVPKEWQAKSVAETQLVVVVGEDSMALVEMCRYTGPSVARGRHSVAVEFREAKTGKLISKTSFLGSMPPKCRQTENYYVTTLYGGDVDYNQLFSWIQKYALS